MMFEDLEIVVQPALLDRVETGPVQFGSDWPGLFIRGEHALVLAQSLLDLVDLLKTQPLAVTQPMMRQIGMCVDLASALRATSL